jgi:hypothetical protein
MDEPIDLSPLALTDHRLRVHQFGGVAMVGDPGHLVKVQKH